MNASAIARSGAISSAVSSVEAPLMNFSALLLCAPVDVDLSRVHRRHEALRHHWNRFRIGSLQRLRDLRRHQHNQFGPALLLVFALEEISENRQAGESGNTRQRFRHAIVDQARDNEALAFAELD